MDPQQFVHILWGGASDPQQFVHILGGGVGHYFTSRAPPPGSKVRMRITAFEIKKAVLYEISVANSDCATGAYGSDGFDLWRGED